MAICGHSSSKSDMAMAIVATPVAAPVSERVFKISKYLVKIYVRILTHHFILKSCGGSTEVRLVASRTQDVLEVRLFWHLIKQIISDFLHSTAQNISSIHSSNHVLSVWLTNWSAMTLEHSCSHSDSTYILVSTFNAHQHK